MRTAMYVNGYDTSRLGLVVEQVDGWMDGLTAQRRTSKLPGRVGAIPLAPDTETTPRTLTVQGALWPKPESLAAVRQALLDLKERLGRGLLELSFVDQADKFLHALVQQHQVVATRPQFASPYSRISVQFFCPDPLIYAVQPSVVGFAAARSSVPLGTACSTPTIRIMGPAVNPVLTYRKADGTSRQTMTFTVTLGTNDYLEIDCELMQVSLYQAGVGAQNNAANLWTSGDFPLFDPQDGDAYASVWPTLEVSAGTGEALYRRAWL